MYHSHTSIAVVSWLMDRVETDPESLLCTIHSVCSSVMHGQCKTRHTVTFPAKQHHYPLAGAKLYCLVSEVDIRTTCPESLHKNEVAVVEPAIFQRQESNVLATKPWHSTRDAPIMHWPIIGRPIIGAKQSADYRLIQKFPETGQKPAVHTV